MCPLLIMSLVKEVGNLKRLKLFESPTFSTAVGIGDDFFFIRLTILMNY